ncbi:hypothetical protein Tco_0999113 [Tanacetum coccineum]
MFERTRQRKEGNVYANTYDDTENKIEKMRNYNPLEHESAPTHPFLAVMNKEEIVKSPMVSLEIEKGPSADMVRDLEANYEWRMSGLREDHARKQDAMQQKNDDDREKLIEDVMRKILGKLLIEVVCYIASTKIIVNEGCVSTGFTDYIPMQNTTTPICEPSKFADGTSKGTADQDMTMTNNPVNQATKLRPTSSIMANLQKLKANVPNDADYDVSYAPLNYKSWSKVPDKEMMWKYVLLVGGDTNVGLRKINSINSRIYKRDEIVDQNPFHKRIFTVANFIEQEGRNEVLFGGKGFALVSKKMHTAGLKSFAMIREEMYDGHCRLFGKGVTNTLIKNVNGDGSASTVPREIVKSPTVSLEVEKGRSVDILRDLKVNCERRMSELKEDHAGN